MRRFLYIIKIVLLFGAGGVLFNAQTYPAGGQNVSGALDFRRDPVKLIDALRSPVPDRSREAAFDLRLTFLSWPRRDGKATRIAEERHPAIGRRGQSLPFT
jgi:hypothetical protein